MRYILQYEEKGDDLDTEISFGREYAIGEIEAKSYTEASWIILKDKFDPFFNENYPSDAATTESILIFKRGKTRPRLIFPGERWEISSCKTAGIILGSSESLDDYIEKLKQNTNGNLVYSLERCLECRYPGKIKMPFIQ